MTTEKDQDLLDLQTTDSFRLYLDEVGRHPLLTKEDEIELSQAYEAGLAARAKLKDLGPDDKDRAALQVTADLGERARRKMIESNLRLVVSIARRFSATGLPLGDLVQEGNLGLLRAVEKFDWHKGFKFSTYATCGSARRSPVAPPTAVPAPSACRSMWTSRSGGCAAPRRACTRCSVASRPSRSWRSSWTCRWTRSTGCSTPPRRSPRWTPRSATTVPPSRTSWRTPPRSGRTSWPSRPSGARRWSRSSARCPSVSARC